MRLAAIQFRSGPDRAVNRRRIASWIDQAEADVVVFPEASQCAFGLPGRDLTGDAEPLDGPFVEALASSGTIVVAGMFESGAPAGKVFNTVVVVGPDGLLASYRKMHLYDALGWTESERVEPGSSPLAVEIGDVTVGIVTCYDLRFPELARVLVDGGATTLLVPAAWAEGPGKGDVWATLLAARAIESTAWVAGAATPGRACCGRSAIIDPAGATVVEAGPDEETVLVAEVTPTRVVEVRSTLPLLAHRRFTVRFSQ